METEGFYMAEKRWRTWETVGLLVVLAAGNLLHFIYDWTGQSPIAAPLAAVNESTWEHMKLFITPWVLWSLVERIALREAIDKLPEKERMTILLRYFKGMTQEQTARVLGVSQVQISRLEHRGLKRLRESFEA